MPVKSIPPGQGPRRCTHFPYCSTKPGQRWHAHVAGPAVWIAAHGRSRTTVCPEWFTDGAVQCHHCLLGELAHVVGYQPLYRELDARPCMVIVYEDVRHQIDKLHFLQRVIVGRADDATATVYVMPTEIQEPAYKTTLPERMRPADISRSLLAVWKNRDVTDWFWRTSGGPAPGPTLAATAAGESPAKAARLAAQLAMPPVPPPPPPVDAVDDAAPVGALLHGTLERVRRKEAKNGKPDVTGA